MAKLVLDTNILIEHFRSFRPLDGKTASDAREWAKVLIADRRAEFIVSPVEVEFLCGIVDEHERVLREAYLGAFTLLDDHKTLPQDWREACRLAKHPGFQARPRDLGDCLITALSDRLKFEVISHDKGLHRQRGRTRQRRP